MFVDSLGSFSKTNFAVFSRNWNRKNDKFHHFDHPVLFGEFFFQCLYHLSNVLLLDQSCEITDTTMCLS